LRCFEQPYEKKWLDKKMDKERRKEPQVCPGSGDAPLVASVGALLLDLRDALRQAERCRLALRRLGYSKKRWQEIVIDIDPELRFALRPQVLDAIITRLQSVGEPVNRQLLVRALNAQGAGISQRIRQSITVNLRAGNLILCQGNKIGLPGWKDKDEQE
jgi:hypothetical protein